MFEPSDTPRVFALPPGCDFSASFVDGFLHRLRDSAPEDLARVEIYVNTRRTERRLHGILSSGPPRLLPRLRLISDLSLAHHAELPAAAPPLCERLELAQLVSKLLESAPELSPVSSAHDLAAGLADVLDEMRGEGVPHSALGQIDVGDHAAHWARTLQFLDILGAFRASNDVSAPGVELRQRLIVEYLDDHWQKHPPDHPIIVAGSTGSRGATAMFMRAIAALPQGAVVLPGVDPNLPRDAWDAISSSNSTSEHPQAVLAKFIGSVGLKPYAVPLWTEPKVANPARNRLISLALRPAPITDQWLTEGQTLIADLKDATSDITLIEADTQRQEADAIALRLRQAVEDNQVAALISPDRILTRRVSSALLRWNIVADDSAGQPLPLTAPGIFLRLIAGIAAAGPTAETMISLLKHPITFSAGTYRGDHLRHTRDLELMTRKSAMTTVNIDTISGWAKTMAAGPPADWVRWLGRVVSCLSASDDRHLREHLSAHFEVAELIAHGNAAAEPSRLWADAAGDIAAGAFAALKEAADFGGMLSPRAYANLFRIHLNEYDVRIPIAAHPNVMIWGPLEARVQGADLVILGGLNEGEWPRIPKPDSWLNRSMRARLGLLLPERQIALSAHDFQQAAAGREVVLTRSRRSSDAPTVPSRWLMRFKNLLNGLGNDGSDALDSMSARGAVWTGLAKTLDTPSMTVERENRPSPSPPPHTRPSRLSVTQIKTLIRDPYAIYARHILRLRRLEDLNRRPDPMIRGNALHRVLERFVYDTTDDLPDNARDILMAITQQELAQFGQWPAAQRMWYARLDRVADWLVRTEGDRRSRGTPLGLEVTGSRDLEGLGFTLTAKADRIDPQIDGGLAIFDYKSGKPPTAAQIKHFDKQLPLEAAIALSGGFDGFGPADIAQLAYIGLSGEGQLSPVDCSADVIEATWDDFKKLIADYQTDTVGYTARARLEKRQDVSDYDHLSRLGEWEIGAPVNLEKVSE